MPYRRRGFSGRRMFAKIKSIKNSVSFPISIGTTQVSQDIVTAVANPSNTASDEVENGCHIKAFWLSLDVCGLAASGTQQTTGFYLFHNRGNNLTAPSPFAPGNSNEKNNIIREWSAMTMRNQDGNPPYHWEGWVKVPKYHQRCGTDDVWSIEFLTDTAAGHALVKYVYKWFM